MISHSFYLHHQMIYHPLQQVLPHIVQIQGDYLRVSSMLLHYLLDSITKMYVLILVLTLLSKKDISHYELKYLTILEYLFHEQTFRFHSFQKIHLNQKHNQYLYHLIELLDLLHPLSLHSFDKRTYLILAT